MGIVLLIGALTLGVPLVLLGACPLVLALSIRCSNASISGGFIAAVCLAIPSALVPVTVVGILTGDETVFMGLLWCVGFVAVSLGSVLAFGVTWARIARNDQRPGLFSLLLRALAPWPLGFALLAVPWHKLNMLGMLAVFGLGVMPAPLGVAWAAGAALRSARPLPQAHPAKPAV